MGDDPESGGEVGKLSCKSHLWGRQTPADLHSAVIRSPASLHAEKFSGPLFSWQENRNVEKQTDCRCWDLDNLASRRTAISSTLCIIGINVIF